MKQQRDLLKTENGDLQIEYLKVSDELHTAQKYILSLEKQVREYAMLWKELDDYED